MDAMTAWVIGSSIIPIKEGFKFHCVSDSFMVFSPLFAMGLSICVLLLSGTGQRSTRSH